MSAMCLANKLTENGAYVSWYGALSISRTDCYMYPTHIYDLSFLNICNNFCAIGYNPAQQKPNCRSSCGNITVLFPFGIEKGCYAREQFYLNCTNETSSTLLLGYSYVVTEIDVGNGLIKFIFPDRDEGSVITVSSDDPGVFVDSGVSVSLKWVVANLTCQEAQANIIEQDMHVSVPIAIASQ
jgi:hypothetical protein